MDPAKKYAYRHILYWATLELRWLKNLAHSPGRVFFPWNWHRAIRQIARAGILADWMHNLAMFSSVEFDHFNEEIFWREYRRLVLIYPDFATYERRFNAALSEQQ